MRPLIQYDLDEPLKAPPQYTNNARGPPAKKRKRNNHQYHPYKTTAQGREAPLQHWDDPGRAADSVIYDEQEGSASHPAGSAMMPSYTNGAEEEELYGEEAVDGYGDDTMNAEEGEDDESRPLTHEEIWDDAALVDAWNSAEAEYEAYHGISKAWKTEPIKKSPLWYNKPYTTPPQAQLQPGPSKLKPPRSTHEQCEREDGEAEVEPDTAPLNFDTYVPTHDPALGVPSTFNANAYPTPNAPFLLPPPSTAVSRDEAFRNALSAMYWSGYWTAVYHAHSQPSGKSNSATPGATGENDIESDEGEGEDGQDLVPTQR